MICHELSYQLGSCWGCALQVHRFFFGIVQSDRGFFLFFHRILRIFICQFVCFFPHSNYLPSVANFFPSTQRQSTGRGIGHPQELNLLLFLHKGFLQISLSLALFFLITSVLLLVAHRPPVRQPPRRRSSCPRSRSSRRG